MFCLRVFPVLAVDEVDSVDEDSGLEGCRVDMATSELGKVSTTVLTIFRISSVVM